MVAILLLVSLISCHASGPRTKSPLRNASKTRHINLGTAASALHLEDPTYTRILGSEFAQLEPENEMKFARVHPEPDRYDFRSADRLVSLAGAHGMLVRGHTLVWHRQVPPWVSAGNFSPAELSAILEDHITTVMQHYASRVYAWDVVNEAFNDNRTMRNTIWYDQPGTGYAGMGTRYIEQALRWAHRRSHESKVGCDLRNGTGQAAWHTARWYRVSGTC